MARTVTISEDSIIAMLKGLPESALVDIFARTLVESDTSPLTEAEQRSYKTALKEYRKGEVVNWEDLR